MVAGIPRFTKNRNPRDGRGALFRWRPLTGNQRRDVAFNTIYQECGGDAFSSRAIVLGSEACLCSALQSSGGLPSSSMPLKTL